MADRSPAEEQSLIDAEVRDGKSWLRIAQSLSRLERTRELMADSRHLRLMGRTHWNGTGKRKRGSREG